MKFALAISFLAFFAAFGVLIFVTDAPIYATGDVHSCTNCHVMDAAYEGWFHGSHRQYTECVDCHAPHDLIPKYYIKAKSGLHDVLHFSTGNIMDPIRAFDETKHIIQENCIRCHSEAVSMIAESDKDSGRYCFTCHRNSAHNRRGASTLPFQDKK